MADADYSNYFRKKRWNWSALGYLPIGLTFLALRLPLFVVSWFVWLLIPDCYIKKVALRWIWFFLGLHVRLEAQLQSMPRVIICNKVSILDYISMKLFLDVEFVSVESQHTVLPPNVPKCFQKDHFVGYLKSLENYPKRYAFVQPQTYVATSYNATALFNAKDLEGIIKAQLLYLSVHQLLSFFSVTVGTNTSLFDIFWILISPMTTIKASMFDIIQREDGVSNEALAELITEKFCKYSKLAKLEVNEEAALRCLAKCKDNVIDLKTINVRSNDFYMKLTPADRFNVRKNQIEKMIEEEKAKYLNRVNSTPTSSS